MGFYLHLINKNGNEMFNFALKYHLGYDIFVFYKTSDSYFIVLLCCDTVWAFR